MFAKTAEFYDLVYSFKDYQAEAAKIRVSYTLSIPARKLFLMLPAEQVSTRDFLPLTFQ